MVTYTRPRWPKRSAECNAESGYEIDASFNSAFANWYLGTDGNVPSNKWDFYSVVLHELGHGLGFLSSFDVSGSYGYWGLWDGSRYAPTPFDYYEMTAASGGFSLIRRLSQRFNFFEDPAHRRLCLFRRTQYRRRGGWAREAVRAQSLAGRLEQLPS